MKDIQYTKDNDRHIFNFYFLHNTQILLAVASGAMLLTFTSLYLLKPFTSLSVTTHFFGSFAIGTFIAMRIYKKNCWLAARKRLEITNDEALLYYASYLIKKIPLADVTDVTIGKEWIIGFRLNTITIAGKEDNITLHGFKSGEDIEKTHEKIRGIFFSVG